jgi:starch synthase
LRKSVSIPNGLSLKIMILTVEHTPETGGGMGTHVLELARGLGQAGCQASVLAYTPGASTTWREGNVTIQLIAPSKATLSGGAQSSIAGGILAFNNDLLAQAETLILEHQQRPDIIHFHEWFTFSAARQLRARFGLPTVGTIHLLHKPLVSWWGERTDAEIVEQEKGMFQEADALITVSHSMQAICQATHHLPPGRLRVVYNGMDPQPFVNQAFKPEAIARLRQTVSQSNEKVVLFAGRLSPQKGISALFAAAAQVIAEIPAVRYLLVGETVSHQFAQTVRSLTEQHPQLGDKVKLLGKIPRQQLAALYQVADVALVPSLYEPFGYAAIEAMAAGVPVVATQVGGLAEIIEHGENGLLVPVHSNGSGPRQVDVAELAAAQIRLLKDQRLAKRLGQAGQQRVLHKFTLEKMTQATINVYQHTISNFQRSIC